jgi:predicted metalloprotease with PDZ domain
MRRWCVALVALWSAGARGDVSYRIDLDGRAAHTVTVEMVTRARDFFMPVWTPGAYELRHWARNLTPLGAEDDAGRSVPFSRVGPDRFHVEAAGAGAIKLRYRVYAAELSDDASQIDAGHAYLNGSSIFLAARGEERTPHRVSIAVPAGWRVATALDDAAGGWEAPGYEALIDAPIEVGKFARGEVRAAGRVYRVAVDGGAGGPSEVPAGFLHDLGAIAETEAKWMGPPPYRNYLLLIHLADGIGRIAALEHAASSSVVIPHRSLHAGEGYDDLLYVAAHELFHAWNARRLRPAELVPYDLEREQRARSLWITEGLTEYYAHRALRAAGLWTRAHFFERLNEQVTRAVVAEARGLTVEEEAELTWQAPDEAAADPDAYYARGHLVALALDAEIRVASDGKRSLDDVVRALLSEADRKGGVLPIDGARLAVEIAHVAGPQVGEHVAAWTRAPHEVEKLDAPLEAVGLKLVRDQVPARTFAGFSAEADGDTLRVVAVGAGGPASGAGLRAGDRILRLDGETPKADWAALLSKKAPGATVAVEAVRATRRLLLELRLEATHPSSARLTETPVTPRVLQLRKGLID